MAAVRRRDFIGCVAASALAPSLARGAARERLPLAFSTLGCPSWDLPTILEQADRLGYAAVELRGLRDELDLTRSPALSPPRLKDSLEQIAARGLRIASVDASAQLHEPEEAARREKLDEARRHIDLAHSLGAPYVRVFGDKIPSGEPRRVTVERIAAGLRSLGEHAEGSGVTVVLESHGDFTRSPDLLELLTSASAPNVGLLWDAHHTVVSGGETPAETFRSLGSFVRHTHFKDSRPDGEGVRYVLTGEGTVPVKATVKVLAAAGYEGYYCFEWEKRWHPEIEEPEIAFPHYARTMTAYLGAAGVRP
jgi:sugar phosphate isomerase/epimerase